MQRMNKHAVSNLNNSVGTYGPKIFEAKQAQTEGLNELVVKSVAKKLQAEAQAKLQNAVGIRTSLAGLGAFANTSA